MGARDSSLEPGWYVGICEAKADQHRQRLAHVTSHVMASTAWLFVAAEPEFRRNPEVPEFLRFCNFGRNPEFPDSGPVFRSAAAAAMSNQGTVHCRHRHLGSTGLAGGHIGPRGHFHRLETKKNPDLGPRGSIKRTM